VNDDDEEYGLLCDFIEDRAEERALPMPVIRALCRAAGRLLIENMPCKCARCKDAHVGNLAQIIRLAVDGRPAAVGHG
jgi:hypothetical protein